MDQQLQFLFEKDDVTWKSLLYNLVKSEQMNPWDIDLSLLSKRYIETLKQMKEMDFRISGKVLLAAAILLKLKSEHLLHHGVDELDRLIARTYEPEVDNGFFSEFSNDLFQVAQKIDVEHPPLIPRTPQQRQRKITIYDLAEALQQALEVSRRKLDRQYPTVKITIPQRKFDISQVIRDVYTRVKTYFHQNQNKKLTFSQLLPKGATKQDKAYTFIPLLHLDNQRKVNLLQEQHFSDFHIELATRKEVDKELGLAS